MFSTFCCFIAALLRCCVTLLLRCFVASLLRCFVASLLRCFVASWLRCFVASWIRGFRGFVDSWLRGFFDLLPLEAQHGSCAIGRGWCGSVWFKEGDLVMVSSGFLAAWCAVRAVWCHQRVGTLAVMLW